MLENQPPSFLHSGNTYPPQIFFILGLLGDCSPIGSWPTKVQPLKLPERMEMQNVKGSQSFGFNTNFEIQRVEVIHIC